MELNKDKWQWPSFTTPEKHLAYLKTLGAIPTMDPPESFIFCPVHRLCKEARSLYRTDPCDGAFKNVEYFHDFPTVAIGDFGIGGAVIAQKMELLHAWGVKKFAHLGLAGALYPDAKIGDVIICDEAIRHDGVSHHYLPPSPTVVAPKELNDAIYETLLRKVERVEHGKVWSLEAIYRETEREIQEMQRAGVLAVDLETASFYAVAKAKSLPAISAFVISDLHTGDVWDPHFYSAEVMKGFDPLLRATCDALLALKS